MDLHIESNCDSAPRMALGIDPGRTGGRVLLAEVEGGGHRLLDAWTAHDDWLTEVRWFDAAGLTVEREPEGHDGYIVAIEDPGVVRADGFQAAPTRTLAHEVGFWRGLAHGAAWPIAAVVLAAPSEWQADAGIARGGCARTGDTTKRQARELAGALLGADVARKLRGDGQVDAALIAWWALRAVRAQFGPGRARGGKLGAGDAP